MRKRLKRETEKLRQSWMQYDEAMLRDYLVEEVEDPRTNIQSILTRHFLLEALFGERFSRLKEEELRFAAVMNWLRKQKALYGESAKELLDALSKGADNCAGLQIPACVSKAFACLPARVERARIPNYVRALLKDHQNGTIQQTASQKHQTVFQSLWREVLKGKRPHRLSVLEPACGSANDYRFLQAFGLARMLDYTGFDLCEKNVRNARALFPQTRFEPGNVFEINSADKSYDLCFVHDLFEHLSVQGMNAAIAEICRVTRRAICGHFFNMAEIGEHQVRPVDDYHWNLLSMAKTREAFLEHGSTVQVLHIGTFLRWCHQCPENYNDGAYTFLISL